MPDHCPGAANLRTPTLSIKKCPQCGGEVEIFSNDLKVACSTCGCGIFNDIILVCPVVQVRKGVHW